MKYSLLILLVISCIATFGQQSTTNIITTALPFLELDPNPRTAAFGEIGVVSSGNYRDAGVFQNPALLSGETRVIGMSLAYSKWLNKLNFGYKLSGFKGYFSIDQKNTIGINFTSFDWGKIMFTDEQGYPTSTYHPWEFYLDGSYSHQINKALSIGLGLKYARSKVFPDHIFIEDKEIHPINTFATDFGIQFKKSHPLSPTTRLNYQIGCSINNFGPKVSYINDAGYKHDFIPTNLRAGLLLNPEIDIDNEIKLNLDIAYQAEKLLVPTPPLYYQGTDSIIDGHNPDISPFQAIFQSFYDAPGGSNEEWHEILHKLGGEARFNFSDKAYIALRCGKMIQHSSKGAKTNTTLGFGIGVFGFVIDYSNYKGKINNLTDTWILSFGFRTRLDKILRF
jgi:hypothetical protein